MAQLSNQKDALVGPSIQAPDSVWKPCFYPVDKVNSIEKTFHCPGVHFMGYTSDFKFCRLAITDEGKENLGQDVQLRWWYHDEALMPLQSVANVHGIIEARKRVLKSLRENAIWGIEKHGRKLEPVYQKEGQFEFVQLQFEGSALISDILVSRILAQRPTR